jgi:hypothetical protein
MNFIDFFKEQYLNKIDPKVVVKFRDGKDGFDNGLGDLFGVDLESDEYAGYVYYWDKGFLDYGLINMKNMNDIVPIELVRVRMFEEKKEIIEKIISYFTTQ